LEAIESTETKVYHENASSNPPSISIQLNQNSSYVRSDISKILHIPSKSRIEVHLQSTRRCQNPVFKGRISGWSLSMIDFEEEVQNDILVGTYDRFHMPMSGQYPLEIILLLCEKYPENSHQMDLLSVCLEHESGDTTHITSRENASLGIDIGSKQFEEAINLERKGRWVHNSLLVENTTQIHSNVLLSEEPEPILTPFQPKGCEKRNQTKDINECKPFVTDRHNRFDEYRYVWSSNRDELNQDGTMDFLAEALNGKNPKVCFLGFSHSQHLKGDCDMVRPRNVACGWCRARFPKNVNSAKALQLNEMNCSHVVVGLFQWPFSFKNRETITFEKFENDMTQAVKTLIQNTNGQILLRSAHPNGLGTHFTQCPSIEARTTINAAIATEILRDIAHSQNLTFLDTSFLIDAVWDSAKDWSHYEGEVAKMEVKYMLSEILKERSN